MKRVVLYVFLIFIFAFALFIPTRVSAAGEPCTGDSGLPGVCRSTASCLLDEHTTPDGDGRSDGCVFLESCCVPHGAPEVSCTGGFTGLPGVCRSTVQCQATSGFMTDGTEGCVAFESCCVPHGVKCGEAGGVCELIVDRCPNIYDPTPIGGSPAAMGCRGVEACCVPLQNGCHAPPCNTGDTVCKENLRCCPDANDCPPPFDPDWNNPPEVKVPVFCKSNDPGDRTTDNTGRLATAIGCIPIGGGQDFISFILRWAFGIGGGIAFLLILYAGFMIMTSAGDPKKLQAGRELLTAAVSGLLLLIFSVFLLRFIGVDILGIPGLGG